MNDLISRQAIIDAIDDITWYHQSYGAMVQGAKNEGHAWYRAEDVYKALAEIPSAEPSADCISRQAAIDEIKALYEWHEIVTEDRAIDHFKRLPSAEPEIIRCKDCKWYGRADKRRFYRGMDCLQKRIDTIVPDKDFCSKAERQEE